MFNRKKSVARIVGNWGITFFGPLIGVQLILGPELWQTLLVSAISSSFATGLTMSHELVKYGNSTKTTS